MPSDSDSPMPSIHVVVVLHNHAQWIESCLASIYAQSFPAHRVTVIDNASIDSGSQLVRDYFPQATLMHIPMNLGFAGGANRATASDRIDSDVFLVVRPDAVLAISALENVAKAFANYPKIGVLGCKILARDVETLHSVGLEITDNGLPIYTGRGERDDGQYNDVVDVLAVPSIAFALRSSAWHDLGGLDEAFHPDYYEDLDFCFRAGKAGWVVATCGTATATFFDAEASQRGEPKQLEAFFRGRGRFLKKHFSRTHWMKKIFPAEWKWQKDWESSGKREIAKKTLWEAFRGKGGGKSGGKDKKKR